MWNWQDTSDSNLEIQSSTAASSNNTSSLSYNDEEFNKPLKPSNDLLGEVLWLPREPSVRAEGRWELNVKHAKHDTGCWVPQCKDREQRKQNNHWWLTSFHSTAPDKQTALHANKKMGICMTKHSLKTHTAITSFLLNTSIRKWQRPLQVYTGWPVPTSKWKTKWWSSKLELNTKCRHEKKFYAANYRPWYLTWLSLRRETWNVK